MQTLIRILDEVRNGNTLVKCRKIILTIMTKENVDVGLRYTSFGVQILVILVFDQECKNISRSQVPKRHAEIFPVFS
jgi:hypothetical protein